MEGAQSPPGVDFSPRIASAQRNTAQCIALVRNLRLLLCMGSRLSLSMAVSTCPEVEQLQAVTTEREALALLEQGQVDVLHCTDALEQGSGDRLVQQAKRRWPALRTLLIITRPHRIGAIRRASRAGCDGLCLERNLGLGTVLTALRTVQGGGVYIDRTLWEGYLNNYPGGQPRPLAALSERQLVQQIFKPGFSTAETVTEISGRGVGMDVVRTNLDKLGGKIEIESTPGKGARFRIKLPLTLAIIPSLLVSQGGERIIGNFGSGIRYYGNKR